MKNRSTFFSLLLETLERSGTGAERAKNLVSGSGAVSGCEKIGWSGSGAGAGGRGAGNGAVSGLNWPLKFRSKVMLALA